MINGEAIEKIEELVQAVQEPVVPPAATAKGADPFVVVPGGWELKYPAVPEFPRRIAQRVELHDATSFSAYVKEFAQESATVFFDEEKRTFLAILDYHGGGSGTASGEKPRWCDHVATFVARTTPEWDLWSGRNQKPFGQVEFATFLEDNMLEVVEPAGAELLEIARTLETKQDVAYSSGIRLDNGAARIHYDEVIKGTANTQAGIVEIPTQFTLQMQVIRGGSAFRFPARLKYRIKDRALILWYEIVRPHKILEQALNETVAAIQEATGLTIRKGVATLPQK
jgi:uncharacterized protein YfdQ (DUF2303 family)